MNKKTILFGAIVFSALVFSLGWLSGSIYNSIIDDSKINKNIQKTSSIDSQKIMQERDKASPHNRIKKEQIFVFDDEVVIKVDNPQWAVFTDTKSMDPVIDSTSKAIQIIPKSEADIHIGDIVAYKSEYKDGIVAHRVVEIGNDELGWYTVVKGDNNNYVDPGKVRFEQIKRVVVAVIY